MLMVGCTPTVTSSYSSDSSSNSSINTSSNDTSNGTSSSTSIPSEEVHFNDENEMAVEASCADISAKTIKDGKLYRVSGVMQYVQNETFGNFELTDETGSLLIYGLSTSSSSISFNGGQYTYSNGRDFNELQLKGGDEVTIEGIFDIFSYSSGYSIVEFMGYPTVAVRNFVGDIKPLTYQNQDPYIDGDYYDNIGESLGTTLGQKLHNLMMNTHTNYVSYSSLKSHFNNSDTHGHSSPYCFYSNQKINNLNREHVWPKSLSNNVFYESYAGSDIQHLRATEAGINSKRGNLRFAPMFEKQYLNTISYAGGGCNYYGAGSTFGCFEPADEIKGDIARIIAYVYVHYTEDYAGIIKDGVTGKLYLNDVIGVGKNNAKALLRVWNAIDPVDEYEMERNEYAYSIQGNRNPFIDHPSYMDRLFNN